MSKRRPRRSRPTRGKRQERPPERAPALPFHAPVEPAGLTFEWDWRKATANEQKHGVSFEEAMTAFADPRALTSYDDEHSEREDRWILVGRSERGRLLSVGHAERGANIRIFTAREAGRRQRRAYEEGEEDASQEGR